MKVLICNKEVEINKTRSAAIKAYCTDCSCGNRTEVKECPCVQCPLYVFRGYVNWSSEKKELSQEQKKAIRDRFVASQKG